MADIKTLRSLAERCKKMSEKASAEAKRQTEPLLIIKQHAKAEVLMELALIFLNEGLNE